MKLTRRQQRFVDEYLIDLNGTQAAIRAAYATNSANEIAAENLAKPGVKAAVNRALAHRANRVRVKQDEVVLELKRIGLADPARAFGPDGALLPLHEMPEDIRRAISSIDVDQRTTADGETRTSCKVRFWPKTEALDKLGRHLGMFVDRHEVEHRGAPAVDFRVILSDEEGGKKVVRFGGTSEELETHASKELASDAVIDARLQPTASPEPAESPARAS